MRTHPDIGLMTARQQVCSRLYATCGFLVVYSSVCFQGQGQADNLQATTTNSRSPLLISMRNAFVNCNALKDKNIYTNLKCLVY